MDVTRDQGGLFPAHLEDFVDEDNPVRAVDAFVDKLDLRALGFAAVDPNATGRPGYHPAVLLKLYIYGYLNAVPSSRRLEREAGRNVELMWLTERSVPTPSTLSPPNPSLLDRRRPLPTSVCEYVARR